MKVLKGFTIFEMLVVMVTSSIAITLSIMIWLNLQKYFQKISINSKTRTEMLLLKDQIRADLKTACFLLKDDGGFRLGNAKEDYSYQVFDEYILRETLWAQDTFKVIVHEIDRIPLGEKSEMLQEVSLNVWAEGVIFPIGISMLYDSKTLLEHRK